MNLRGARPRAWAVLFAGITFVYLYFIPYFPTLNNPNEVSRIYSIRAAVELHKLTLNEQITRYGMVNDLARRGGLFYLGKAPGTTYLGAPIYATLRAIDAARGRSEVPTFRLVYVLRLFGTILPSLAFVAAFRRFLRRHLSDEPIADALSVALALGSMLLPYALIYVNHSLTAAAAFGAIIAIDAGMSRITGEVASTDSRVRPAGLLYLGLAGFLVAMASALDYALFPVSIALFVYSAIRVGRRPLAQGALLLGAAGPAIATAIYHQICWGGPFKLSTSFLANAEFAANTSRGLFGIIGASSASIKGVLVSPAKGLLFFSPIFAPALIGAVAACKTSRRRGLAALCLGISLWMLLYNMSLVNWDAGWTVGPRYSTAIVPFLLFGAALSWESLGDRPRLKAALLPIGIGLLIASVALITMTSVLFPHLQPEFKNPAFEVIWPLWRDAYTPHTLLGLSGRAAQIPFLLVVSAILVYLIAIGSGWWMDPRPSAARRVGLGAAAALVAAAYLGAASLPRTEPAGATNASTTWLRTRIWEPRVP